jgi:predicted nucleic acid-binding protein
VVVNTTPIIALTLAAQLALLQRLYVEVVILPTVQAEVLTGGPGGIGVRELQTASWIHVVPLQDPRRADLLTVWTAEKQKCWLWHKSDRPA